MFSLVSSRGSHVLARGLALAILCLMPAGPAGAQAPAAEWTIMVFMNAKNNLEAAGIDDFLEMAKVGSSSAVNVVTQFGRPKGHYVDDYGAWSGVKRYRIEKDLEPLANKALMTLPENSPEWNMGSIESLAGFVGWAQQRYPAKKYMLIIWNHGQGWRLQLTAPKKAAKKLLAVGPQRVIGGVRSVSHDEDSGGILYNRQIQDGLTKYLKGQKLDVIAFDACLMAMLETAYALREISPVMVASEELEPGAGWQYDTWLALLAKTPQASSQDIARMAVESYGARYKNSLKTTLSAVDLTKAGPLAQSISELVRAAERAGPAGSKRILDARAGIESYGDGDTQPNYIDLGMMLDSVLKGGTADDIGKAATHAKSELNRMVLANYRSDRVNQGFGSNGLSIFYPANAASFKADPDGAGYLPLNTDWPVQFVQDHAWSCFLVKHLLGAVEAAAQRCPSPQG